MLELDKVECEQFAACLNQDFEIAMRRTTADYADISDEEIISESPSVSVSVLSA
jgi:hypothetical protein